MKQHFHVEISKLRQELLRMSALVEEALQKACISLFEGNLGKAWEVIETDKQVDALEILIDDKGHSLLALAQPLAHDLRMITMILKANKDLERMGDHAVNIAESTLYLSKESGLKIDAHLPEMSEATQAMLRDCLRAFAGEDTQLAQDVLERDDIIDSYHQQLYTRLAGRMEKDPSTVKAGTSLLMVSHNLERIGDLVTNLAEDVIYMKQGREVRHHHTEPI